MTYTRLIVGDPSIVRFWDAAQISRPQLVGVTLKPASCMDTLTASLSEVNDGLDFVVVSVITSLVLEEASAAEVYASSLNIINDSIKRIKAAAKKSSKVEVMGSNLSVCFVCRVLYFILFDRSQG